MCDLNKDRIYLGPHTFGHAFAIISHLIGVDVYHIMKSLGHEQFSTSEYLEKVFEKERHAIHLWFGEYIYKKVFIFREVFADFGLY